MHIPPAPNVPTTPATPATPAVPATVTVDGVEWPIVPLYSRERELAEGRLIDVSKTAREMGIRYPVALTAALWADINAIPESQSHQDPKGRLWDVLWMFHWNARCSEGNEFCFTLIMHVGEETEYTAKAYCGPGDDFEPTITLMRPEEE